MILQVVEEESQINVVCGDTHNADKILTTITPKGFRNITEYISVDIDNDIDDEEILNLIKAVYEIAVNIYMLSDIEICKAEDGEEMYLRAVVEIIRLLAEDAKVDPEGFDYYNTTEDESGLKWYGVSPDMVEKFKDILNP